MKHKLRVLVMGTMISAAAFCASAAYSDLKNASRCPVPEEIYAPYARQADSAGFFLGSSGGYVTVYKDRRFREPLETTDIETALLPAPDRAMLEVGIPVRDRTQLLMLLEDLR